MQIFHTLGPIKRSLCSGVPGAFEQRLNRNRGLCAEQFCKQASLIKSAFALPRWMQWDRNNDAELTRTQPFVFQRGTEQTGYKMAKLNLAPVFKFVNDLANNTAPAVCGDGGVKVDLAVGAVGARKYASNSAVEGV